MIITYEIRKEAINLRTKGFTYPEISKMLGGINSSTIASWVSTYSKTGKIGKLDIDTDNFQLCTKTWNKSHKKGNITINIGDNNNNLNTKHPQKKETFSILPKTKSLASLIQEEIDKIRSQQQDLETQLQVLNNLLKRA